MKLASAPVRLVLVVGLVSITACSTPPDKDGETNNGATNNATNGGTTNGATNGGTTNGATNGASCVDEDEDGFGSGTTADAGLCDLDCDDDDASINPGATETCDGVDNDCDDEIDEPADCGSAIDCPDSTGTIPSCEDDVCVYRPPNQLGDCASVTLGCVDGEREPPPAECQ